MTDFELVNALRDQALEVEAGSTRRLLELAARRIMELIQPWVRISARPPREEDADHDGCVLIWHRRTGPQFCGWKQVAETEYVKYWCAMPTRPPGEPTPQELAEQELRELGFGRYGLLTEQEIKKDGGERHG
jgi:hypothetical protein